MKKVELILVLLSIGFLNMMCRAQQNLTPYIELTGFENGKVLKNEMTCQFAGMDIIKIQNLNINSGQARMIDVSLGLSGTLTHYLFDKKK